MAEVLVTGATGTVAFQVVRELQRRGVSVRVFVRDHDKAKALFRSETELAIGDLADPDSIRAAMLGVERVFLACSNSPRQVEYEKNVIDVAQEAWVRQVVKLSAFGAQIGSPLAFWDTQGQIEQHLRSSGLSAVILRPHFFMSNLLAARDTIAHTARIFAPASTARIAMIDPRDVAATAAVILTSVALEDETYVLSGPEALTYAEAAAHLSEALDSRIEFVDVPDEAARQSMRESGMPDWFADNLITLFGFLRQGVAAQTTDAVQKLTRRPPRRFAEFACDHARLFGIR